MSDFLVISSSLNPDSKSRALARVAFESLNRENSVEWIDLRDLSLPMCDGAQAYGHKEVKPLADKIAAAKCVLLGIPVYNYASAASAKNMIELTGKAWTDKVVGFLCAAGGRMSYMSVMGLANSLMLDFRCLIIPRFVYADKGMFEEGGVPNPDVQKRIEELATVSRQLTSLLTAK